MLSLSSRLCCTSSVNSVFGCLPFETPELVDLRDGSRRSALVRPDKEFFSFVQLIESIYLENLSVKMMLSYYEGDLLPSIAAAIKSEKQVIRRFESLLDDDERLQARSALLLDYVVVKFGRMRGNWFVKAMAGQAVMSFREVQEMSTRKNVAAKTAALVAANEAARQAKAKAAVVEAKPEDESQSNDMYKDAFENLAEFVDDDSD